MTEQTDSRVSDWTLPREISIRIAPREDGGLRIWSDDVPGLVLSGPPANKAAMLRDLAIALPELIAHNGLQSALSRGGEKGEPLLEQMIADAAAFVKLWAANPGPIHEACEHIATLIIAVGNARTALSSTLRERDEAVKAEREACAKLADEKAAHHAETYRLAKDDPQRDRCAARSNTAADIAEEIRARAIQLQPRNGAHNNE